MSSSDCAFASLGRVLIALAVLFFAETFFTDRGLGFFVVDSWMKSAYVGMTAGIVISGISVCVIGTFVKRIALLACLDKREPRLSAAFVRRLVSQGEG